MLRIIQFYFLISFLKVEGCDQQIFKFNPGESVGKSSCQKMLIYNFKIEDCKYLIFSSKKMSYQIIINKFQKFSQIDFSCINSTQIAFSFTFIPTSEIILSNLLSFHLSEPQKNPVFNLFPEIISLEFVFIKGFELYSNVFSSLLRFYDQIMVTFYYSSFTALTNVSTKTNCTDEKIDQSIFSEINTLKFAFTTKYYKDTCALIFQHSVIINLRFYGLSDVFIKRNMLGFIKMKRNLNINIKYLSLYFYRIDFDENLLEETVFGNLKILYLKGRLTSFSRNVFDFCNQLLVLILQIENLEIFFDSDIWLKSLTSNQQSKAIFFLIDEKSKLENASLCLFENLFFAKNLSVYLFWTSEVCNCEKIWFYENSTLKSYFLNQYLVENEIDYLVPMCVLECVESRNKKYQINFDFPLNNCIKYSPQPGVYLSDLLYNYEKINFVLVVLIPIISFIGLSTNLLNIFILIQILKKTKSDEDNYLEKTMLINSLINFCYFIIYLIHLMNKCVYINGIFCSKINRFFAVQLFEIIFFEFFLNILKYLSNISLIILSITRLYLLLKKKVKFFFKYLKKNFVILFFFSCLISVEKFFTSKINLNYLALEDKEYDEFPIKNSFQLLVLRERTVTYFGNKAIIFYVLFIANFLINDFLLIVILIIIDFLIVYYFRKNIKGKKKALRNMELLNRLNTKEDDQFRITLVIMLNIFILFSLKTAHFIFSTKILAEKLKSISKESLCIYQGRICTIYQEIGEVFYSVSNIYTIILFYYLNKKFRQFVWKIFVYFS